MLASPAEFEVYSWATAKVSETYEQPVFIVCGCQQSRITGLGSVQQRAHKPNGQTHFCALIPA